MVAKHLQQGRPALLKNLSDAIEQTPPPPCDECCMRERCGAEQRVCRDFINYASSRPLRGDRRASQQLYQIFFAKEDGEENNMETTS